MGQAQEFFFHDDEDSTHCLTTYFYGDALLAYLQDTYGPNPSLYYYVDKGACDDNWQLLGIDELYCGKNNRTVCYTGEAPCRWRSRLRLSRDAKQCSPFDVAHRQMVADDEEVIYYGDLSWMRYIYGDETRSMYQYMLARGTECFPSGLFGDYDGDCEVTEDDIDEIADHWGCTWGQECYDLCYDLDGDYEVTVIDCQRVGAHYGDYLPHDPPPGQSLWQCPEW